MSQRLLLVEDDPVLARGLRFNLESEGYAVQHVDSGSAAIDAVAAEPPALVLLDLSLPDMDGLEVLRALRERGAPPPIVCLTARAAETDVVMALREGADDYVKKPFGLAELLARVDAVLRRAGAESAAPGVRIGEVLVELEARKLVHADREEELTPTEAELLAYLLQRRGQASAASTGRHERPEQPRVATYLYDGSARRVIWLERWGHEVLMAEGVTVEASTISFLPGS